ncbi:MAG: FAD-dependent oxidoreductase [Chloroflexi bacterium]|nr:FAD-dependent oxidoreductase [Chloroflexota bacterium]
MKSDLLVVGAGTMGGWTAYLAQLGGGRQVTLLDAWGPGNPRASSGDESRITRAAHGSDALYTRWSRRSLDDWKQLGEMRSEDLFQACGVLWFAHQDDGFEARSIPVLRAERVPYERLTPAEVARRWPVVGASDLAYAVYEPEGGALMARRGCRAVTDAFGDAGGTFERAAVRPGSVEGPRLEDVIAADGRRWSADTFVFACGPWLPHLFPDVLGNVIRVTKQDVVFFGPPARSQPGAPAWCDFDLAYYGLPDLEGRGPKMAPDRLGPIFDPTNGERLVDPESVRLARTYLRRRFPGLADAPVVETRVCQYESTPDGHFLIAPHPEWENVWLVGGGSGHGFKHGPGIGRYLLARIDGAAEGIQEGVDEARFRLGPRQVASAARTGGDEMWRSWEAF